MWQCYVVASFTICSALAFLPARMSGIGDHPQDSRRGLVELPQRSTSSQLSDRLGVGLIKIVDRNNLWAVGHIRKPQGIMEFVSLILHSANGGRSWEVRLTDPERYFRDVYFVNREVGWVCGDEGLVLTSTDGGRRWSRQNTNTESDLDRIRFIDAKVGWAMTGDGEVLRSTDGGLHWSAHGIEDAPGLDGRPLHILGFADFLNVWIGGQESHLYQSSDGGFTWTARGTELVSLIDRAGKHQAHFTDLEFISPSVGFIAAYVVPKVEFLDVKHGDLFYKGIVFKTENGGRNWSVLLEEKDQLLRSVEFISETEIWVFLADDEVLHTTDGAKTWNRVPGLPKTAAVQFADSNHGWARIDRGSGHYMDLRNSRIYYTNDGGKSWKMSKMPALTERMLR